MNTMNAGTRQLEKWPGQLGSLGRGSGGLRLLRNVQFAVIIYCSFAVQKVGHHSAIPCTFRAKNN